MIRDHEAINAQALALLAKLGAQPQDNFVSKSLLEGADKLVNEMSQLRGAAFDRRYAENELAYHKAVNNLVENAFIPNIEKKDDKILGRKRPSLKQPELPSLVFLFIHRG